MIVLDIAFALSVVALFFGSGRIVGYLDRTFLADRNPAAGRNAARLVHLAGFLIVSSALFLGMSRVASGPAVSLFLIPGGLFLALCGTRLLSRLDRFLFET